ncbi:MAG TPA: hypothetical protein VFW68_11545 [Rhodocyclaceae bacterium]|nr:hypothetical protein [Rhodocyclaceae bacterium]
MTKDQYDKEMNSIEARYRIAKNGCDSLAGNAKDVCMADAKGKREVSKAELEAHYQPSERNNYDLAITKAQTTYDVDKEKCNDKAGNDKDVCVKEAKAALIKAKADAWTLMKGGNPQAAQKDKRDADYEVAKEKCNSLAGDAKERCINEAKARFGKS